MGPQGASGGPQEALRGPSGGKNSVEHRVESVSFASQHQTTVSISRGNKGKKQRRSRRRRRRKRRRRRRRMAKKTKIEKSIYRTGG